MILPLAHGLFGALSNSLADGVYYFAPMDQDDGDTTIIDSSLFGHSAVSVDSCEISDTHTRYNHNTLQCPAGSSISYTMNLGLFGDFTIELDVYISATPALNYSLPIIHYGGNADGVSGFLVEFSNNVGSEARQFFIRESIGLRASAPAGPVAGEWVSFSLCYYQSTSKIRIFANGQRSNEFLVSNPNKTTSLRFGDGDATYGVSGEKYLSEILITRGVAKYTENYTPENTSRIPGVPNSETAPPTYPDPNALTPGIATTSNTRGKVSLANSWGARIACDGSVVSWGAFAPTAINSVLPDGTTFTRVSVAGTGGIALKADGDAVVWGYKPNAAYYGGSPVLYQSPPDDMDIRDVVALSGLPYFYCLLPDGSVYSWNGEAGEIVDDTDLIPDDEEYAGIAAGSYFGAGVLSDGTVSVWASSLNGSSVALLDVPVEATDIIDIACGYYHIVALKDDGSIVCWGNDDNDQCQVPVLSSPAVSISCGSVSSHATLQNGEVVSWGSNTYGEASPPSSLIDAVRVYPSAGSSIFAARSNGNIVGWGRNTSDQVSGAQGEQLFCAATEGTDTPPDPDPSPDPVPPPEPAPVFTLPLAKNPVVYADAAMFGLHYNGRILLWGREGSITRNAPVFLRKAYTDMTVVFDGISYAVLVLQTNGRIAGWGSDTGAFEKLKSPFVDNGNRALFDYINAKQVTALPSAIYKYITVVLEDGTVDCKYLSYKVGSPPPPRPKPSLIYRPPAPSSGGPAVDDNPYLPSGGLPITNAIQVSCTNDMCFALGSDGVVHGWGPASLGAYYLSPLTSYTEQTGSVGAPGQYSRGLSDIVKIDSQFGLVVALDDSGEVTVWGKPDMQSWVPQPDTLPTIVDVAAGKHHIVALGDDGVIYCWGNNKVGQCNVPAGLGRVNRIRASDYQSIAILDSGKVVVWGAFPAYTQKSINQINFYQ